MDETENGGGCSYGSWVVWHVGIEVVPKFLHLLYLFLFLE